MNRLELAAAAGVTPAAITKSKLPRVRLDDGSLHFDSKDPQVIAYINRKSLPRRTAQAKKEKAAKAKAEAAPPNPEYNPPPQKKPRQAFTPPPRQPGFDYGSDDPDTRNMELKNRKLELDIARARGDVIPKKLARDYQARIYEADTTQLRQLPDRLAGRLAGEARGAESEAAATIQVMATMSEEIDRILENVARIMREFRKHTQPAVFALEHGEVPEDEDVAE